VILGTLCGLNYKLTLLNSGAYTTHPRSISISDLNKDLILDIIVANSATDNIGIFLGNGNGMFEKGKTYSTGSGSYPYSIAIGDFDNDNKMDIVVANYGTNSLGLFFGYGNGTFTDQKSLSMGSSHPLSIAVGNLNNDTYLDIVIVNSGTNSIGVLLGIGHGSFGILITYSTGYDSLPSFAIINDLNGDNRLDIAVANSGTGNIGIFLGYGDGTFTNQKTHSTGRSSNPNALGFGDFNHDHKLDLVVTIADTGAILMFLGYGNGSFASEIQLSVDSGSTLQNLVVTDFNNDQQLDIAVVNYNSSNIGILMGYGNGKFADQVYYSTGSTTGPWSMAVGYLNDDNQLDIAVANYESNSIGILIAASVEPGAQQNIPIINGSNPSAIKVGDFNNDTQLDIVVTNYNSSNICILLGNGGGLFIPFKTYSTGPDSNPQDVTTGDLNNDGRLDIIVVNDGTDNVGVFLGYGDGTFINQMTYSTGLGSNPSCVEVGDFNGDNRLDIVVANAGTDTVLVLLGYGNGMFGIPIINPMHHGSQPQSIAIGDFNNDNRLDIAVALLQNGVVSVLLGYGNGTFQMAIICLTGQASYPTAVTVGDFNHDKLLDIAVINQYTFNLGIFLGHGNGTFGMMNAYPTGTFSLPSNIGVADFNNDGLLDAAVANTGTNIVGFFFGYDNGTFASQTTAALYSSDPISIAIGNFNQDSWIDIVVANSLSDDITVLLGNYYVNFQSPIFYLTGSGSHPYSIVVADFDKDNKLDLAVAYSLTDNIGVLYGYGNGSFTAETTYSSGDRSLPYSIATADVNNDNKLDIVFANRNTFNIGILLGSNNRTFETMTTYSTDMNVGSVSIAIDDMNNDDQLDIITAQFTANSIGIFFGYNYTNFISSTILSVKAPFTFVAVGDFNNDHHLDIAVDSSAANNIVILLGYGNGSFTSHTVCSTGEGSVPNTIVLGDFNNDNQLDISVLNQGMNNIGILLGYGDGTFAPITMFPLESNSKSVDFAVEDFNNDDRLDIVVANPGTSDIGIFIGYGNGTFASQMKVAMSPGSEPTAVVVDDFNKDGSMDIGVTITNIGSVGILLGYGNGTFKQVTEYFIEGEISLGAIAIGDFNNDKRIDIVVTSFEGANIGIFLGHGDGTFNNGYTYSTGSQSNPLSLIVGDFNSDNRLDIAVVNYGTINVGIFYGYNDGTFTALASCGNGDDFNAFTVAAGDLNHDNQLDIVLLNKRGNTIYVLFANDSKPFSSFTVFPTGLESLPWNIAIGDFNNDNQNDIVFTNYGKTDLGILLGYGNRTFQDVITYSIGNGSQPISIATGKFNDDNCLDIAIANDNTDNIGILLGYCNGTFQKTTFYSTEVGSSPNSITLADFNNDNVTDISVANTGSNNIGILLGYRNGTFDNQRSYAIFYDSRPASIASGDFNRDGWTDIAVVNYDSDNFEIFLKIC
jgi:predicted Zn-dependent protease with MMP-like domain